MGFNLTLAVNFDEFNFAGFELFFPEAKVLFSALDLRSVGILFGVTSLKRGDFLRGTKSCLLTVLGITVTVDLYHVFIRDSSVQFERHHALRLRVMQVP